ncbi:MAG: hypothetical protein JSV03_14780 [Planctomycetota bacterium]|nr:MAG: hypothetical protein JSV03_14780 [Planctomycetota bacterium]
MRNRALFVCMFVIIDIVFVNSGLGQETKSADKDESLAKPRLVELSLQPAKEPVPALKYLLFPDPIDQTPGNAEPLFSIAGDMMNQGEEARKTFDKIHDWLEMPVEELPREEAQKLLKTYKNALRYAKLASRRECCQWDFSIRTEGINALLSPLAPQRNIARLLALQIRLDISEGRFVEALEKLQTGYAMARHVGGDGPTLIQNLVGVAIADLMSKQLEYWIDTPGSPNLYWALADIPSPLIDAREGLRFERLVPYCDCPQLWDMKKRVMTEEEVDNIINVLMKYNVLSPKEGKSEEGGPSWVDKLFADEKQVKKAFGKSKQYLSSQGFASKFIEAMPVKQVVLIYSFDRYLYWRDEMFKWFGLPYYQACKRLEYVEEQLGKARASESWPESIPIIDLLPSITRARFYTVRMSRGIAALRCLEAIRIYASANDGKLPGSLDIITQVPIPIDPVTGKPFIYRVEGATAFLESWAPKEMWLVKDHSVKYQLTIKK